MRILPAIALLLLLAGTAVTQTQTQDGNRGEIALRALKEGFPERIGEIAFNGGDWTVMVGGELFFWAGGKLLPQSELQNADSYGSYSFYTIPERPADPSSFSPQYTRLMRERSGSTQRLARKDVNPAFQAALYGGMRRAEVEALQRNVRFLGFRVNVHSVAVDALKLVEDDIMEWEGAADFIATLGSIGGFSWREIAGTQRMSYHSMGLAVDIQPRSRGDKPIYWLWESEKNDDWLLVPLENRWNPPAEVIEAFRRHGFIWGGNWVSYDNMHFEYRPELLAYTRLVSGNRVSASGSDQAAVAHHVYPDNLPLR